MRPLAKLSLFVSALSAASTCIAGQGVPSAMGYWALPIGPQGSAPPGYHSLAAQVEADACGVCHPKQHQEWRTSLHAKADSMGLLGQLPAFDAATQRQCLECHAPRAEQQALWFEQGTAALGQLKGVDCTACHVRKHQRFGPNTVVHTPHGKVESLPLFQESAFCAPCHQFGEDGVALNGKPLENTYQEWLASRHGHEGRSCQSCHMPEGQHQFKGIHDPDMTRQGLKLEVRRTELGVAARAWNAGAGHALPTYPTPRIRLALHWSEGRLQRRREHVIQRHLDWNSIEGWRELSDTRLLPDESVELAQSLAPSVQAMITVVVEPDADYHDRVYPELLDALDESLSDSDLALLDTAWRASGQSSYCLYRSNCPPWKGADFLCPVTIPDSQSSPPVCAPSEEDS